MDDVNVTDWAAIVIAIASLAWTIKESMSTRSVLKKQDEQQKAAAEQQEYRALLDNFLLPLKSALGRSKLAFESLTKGAAGEVHRLEYYPRNLRNHFEELSDKRRIFWVVEINQIHEHNQQSIQLIDGFASRSRLSSEFQRASEAFRHHARTWKVMWDAVTDAEISTDTLPGELIADPFPKDFDTIVAREVDRVKSAAGL